MSIDLDELIDELTDRYGYCVKAEFAKVWLEMGLVSCYAGHIADAVDAAVADVNVGNSGETLIGDLVVYEGEATGIVHALIARYLWLDEEVADG